MSPQEKFMLPKSLTIHLKLAVKNRTVTDATGLPLTEWGEIT